MRFRGFFSTCLLFVVSASVEASDPMRPATNEEVEKLASGIVPMMRVKRVESDGAEISSVPHVQLLNNKIKLFSCIEGARGILSEDGQMHATVYLTLNNGKVSESETDLVPLQPGQNIHKCFRERLSRSKISAAPKTLKNLKVTFLIEWMMPLSKR